VKVSDRKRFRRARIAALGLAPALGTQRAPSSALDVARELGALQAQDYASGVWSLGVRSGLALAAIEQAIVDRQIVRTWPMRGTIHWVPAEDARWMCELLARRVLEASGPRYAQFPITPTDLERAGTIFEAHLREPVSRPDVAELLEANGVDPSGQRVYHLVSHHCMTGLLCQGPRAGNQPTFVLIDSWVRQSAKPSRESAIATIVERYVRSHGPVTEKDVAGWVAGTLGFARDAIAALGERIVREEIDGETWLTHVDARSPSEGSAGVQLLPQWDELLLGYKTRDVSLPDAHVARVVPGRNMVFQPTLVIDGEVSGVWKRRETKRSVVVDVESFVALTAKVRRELDAAAAGYGRFLGRDVELRVTER